ncbi:MAG: amidohydrolase family protein, partial [Deltaproteobacteria bacterium]|nr:amidohydrolase family protein [Deltaproteobacteria bacterium]
MTDAIAVIDADAHVEECEETFSEPFLEKPCWGRRPRVVGSNGRAFWLIEDQLFPKLQGKGCHILGTPNAHANVRTEISALKPETIESMEMRDVEQRLRDMKKEGIALQVIYPTLFLGPRLSGDLSLLAALYRAYNSWIARRCAERPDQFKWVAIVPLQDVGEAVREVQRAQGLGAVGVMIPGTADDRLLNEPAFLPFFEACSHLDLPIAIHVSWSCPSLNNLYADLFSSVNVPFVFPLLAAFVAIVGGGILDRFPSLRLAFLEAGCEWVPFWVDRMEHFYEFAAERVPRALPPAGRKPSEYLRGGQIYVSC